MINAMQLAYSAFSRKNPQRPSLDFETSDVNMAIAPEDFPGDEKHAREVIPALYRIYQDDATMSSMTFARGSVLMQDAQNVTKDMVTEIVLNGAN